MLGRGQGLVVGFDLRDQRQRSRALGGKRLDFGLLPRFLGLLRLDRDRDPGLSLFGRVLRGGLHGSLVLRERRHRRER